MFHSESYINFLSSVSGSPNVGAVVALIFLFIAWIGIIVASAVFVVDVILQVRRLDNKEGKFNKILYQHIHDEQTTQHIIYICMSCLESLRLFYLQSLIILLVFTPE